MIANLAILIIAFVIRITGLPSKALWYDELQSVTHAYLPLVSLLKSVHRFDPHPPLYYIQLHGWLGLGISDLWIKLNSVLWSSASVFSLFVVGRHIFDDKVGSLAALLLSLFPFAVAYAQEARMYSLLMFLGIWTLFFTHNFMAGYRPWLMGGGILLSTLAFLYSHGAGFMILFSTSSYAIIYVIEACPQHRWRRFFLFCGLQWIIVILYVPWLRQAQMIRVGHTIQPDLDAILTTLSILLFGFTSFPNGLCWSAVGLLFGIILVVLARDKRRHNFMISFVVVPVVVCIVISYVIRPIWLYRTLAHIIPFLSLAVALALVKTCRLIRKQRVKTFMVYGLLTLVCGFLISALINQQLTHAWPWDILGAAEFIQKTAQPGDRIYLPNERLFWGFGWYFVAPGRVNPLDASAVLTMPNGIRVFSQGAMPDQLGDGSCYWLVYRAIDNPPPLDVPPADILGVFRKLNVAWTCAVPDVKISNEEP